MFWTALTKQGLSHSKNEDNYYIPSNDDKKETKLFIVCDGLGGHEHGELASKLCIESIVNDFSNYNNFDNINNWIESAINRANEYVIENSRKNNSFLRMATTVSILVLEGENRAYIGSVGDSRLYYYTSDKLKQLSADDSPSWERFKQNLISKDDLLNQYDKNILNKAIGLEANLEFPAYKAIELEDNFLFLICSDGLSDYLKDSDIENIIKENDSLININNHLYENAINAGSLDDVTLVTVSNFKKE